MAVAKDPHPGSRLPRLHPPGQQLLQPSLRQRLLPKWLLLPRHQRLLPPSLPQHQHRNPLLHHPHRRRHHPRLRGVAMMKMTKSAGGVAKALPRTLPFRRPPFG